MFRNYLHRFCNKHQTVFVPKMPNYQLIFVFVVFCLTRNRFGPGIFLFFLNHLSLRWRNTTGVTDTIFQLLPSLSLATELNFNDLLPCNSEYKIRLFSNYMCVLRIDECFQLIKQSRHSVPLATFFNILSSQN